MWLRLLWYLHHPEPCRSHRSYNWKQAHNHEILPRQFIKVGCSWGPVMHNTTSIREQKWSDQALRGIRLYLLDTWKTNESLWQIGGWKTWLHSSWRRTHRLKSIILSKFKKHLTFREQLRDFYNTKKLLNRKRHIEIQKAHFCAALCRKERTQLCKASGNVYFYIFAKHTHHSIVSICHFNFIHS